MSWEQVGNIQGPPGPPGVSNTEGYWRYSSNTTIADPNASYFRVNNAVLHSATQMALSVMTQNSVDATNLLKQLQPGDQIFIQDKDNAANWIRYNITGTPTNNTTWFQIPVSTVSYGGTAPNNNAQAVFAFFAGTAGGTINFVNGEIPTLVSGSDYHTAQPFQSGSLKVYLNGLRQKVTADYTITGTNAFHMILALTTNDQLLVDYIL